MYREFSLLLNIEIGCTGWPEANWAHVAGNGASSDRARCRPENRRSAKNISRFVKLSYTALLWVIMSICAWLYQRMDADCSLLQMLQRWPCHPAREARWLGRTAQNRTFHSKCSYTHVLWVITTALISLFAVRAHILHRGSPPKSPGPFPAGQHKSRECSAQCRPQPKINIQRGSVIFVHRMQFFSARE